MSDTTPTPTPPKPYATAKLEFGEVRLLCLTLLGRALRVFALYDDLGRPTVRREPLPMLRLRDEEEEAAQLRALVYRIGKERPLDATVKLKDVNGLIQEILDSKDIAAAQKNLNRVRELAAKLLNSRPGVGSDAFKADIVGNSLDSTAQKAPAGEIETALQWELERQKFLASVMQMCADQREAGQTSFGPDEELALEYAYRLLDEGVRLPRVFQSISHLRNRSVQTYVSFADAGDGHLAVTVRDPKLLDGLIVHIEYIDRDGVGDQEAVEAYRLPAIRDAARVCLHVGTEAPCTVYIGRPHFEANYQLGLLKAAHTTASVCSAMFAQGVADCKVAMDGLTARQAIDFMQAVAGNVVRDTEKQRLSAAFNINRDLVDDLTTTAPRTLKGETQRLEIATLAIHLVEVGKFNKVAWDGALPLGHAKPILVGQLKRVELLSLVHSAHEKGLETYISAGMQPEHMRDATYTGVGAVGIGTSLHHRSKDGIIGQVDAVALRKVLEVRKAASNEIPAILASDLAQLDWEYHRGLLADGSPNERRHSVFEALKAYLEALDLKYPNDALPKGGPAQMELSSAHQQLFDSFAQAQDGPEIGTLDAPADRRQRSRPGLAGLLMRFVTLGSDDSDYQLAGESPVDDGEMDESKLWAHQMISQFEVSPEESTLNTEAAEELRRLLRVGDRTTLRRLYPS